MPDYSARRRAAQQRLADQGIDLLFLPRSTNLHYLTGIPREERATIFDPFVRGQEGSRVRDGSGLGLFITRRVVEAHGGRIWFDPHDEGSTFHVLLPVDGRELQRSAS